MHPRVRILPNHTQLYGAISTRDDVIVRSHVGSSFVEMEGIDLVAVLGDGAAASAAEHQAQVLTAGEARFRLCWRDGCAGSLD